MAVTNGMDGQSDADGQNRQNGRCVGCCGRRAAKGESHTDVALPPLSSSRGERGGMEWHCCKWPLPLLFCYNNDNFIAFQPLSLSLPKEAKCSTERAFSFYLALGRAWNAFSASKNPSQILSSLFDASICHVTLRWKDTGKV